MRRRMRSRGKCGKSSAFVTNHIEQMLQINNQKWFVISVSPVSVRSNFLSENYDIYLYVYVTFPFRKSPWEIKIKETTTSFTFMLCCMFVNLHLSTWIFFHFVQLLLDVYFCTADVQQRQQQQHHYSFTHVVQIHDVHIQTLPFAITWFSWNHKIRCITMLFDLIEPNTKILLGFDERKKGERCVTCSCYFVMHNHDITSSTIIITE